MGLSIGRLAVLTSVWSLYAASLQAQINVTTYHNDNARTGQNVQETVLTPANVNSSQFGKLFTLTVDGTVYSQPLILSNVNISGGTHNVALVTTEHDSVYAFDADTGRLYWQKSMIPQGGSTVSSGTDLNCGDVATEVGITGTPVIDPTTGTLYVVAKVKVNGAISQYLHALDVSTAAEKFGGPVNIQASVPGTATDGDGSMVTFNARLENQRPALLLENGHVVIGWAGHCDRAPWHGWVMSYGASTLTLEAAYNTSATGYGNGIWMSASGLAADTSGNIYFATGNGSWNATDLGDSIVKLGPPSGAKFPVYDYFTPYNQAALSNVDHDLSAGGLILLPTLSNGQQLLAVIGKEGKLYLLDRNNMGKYCVAKTPACTNSDPQIVQEIAGVFSGVWGVPAYWNGTLYWAGGNDDTGEAEPLRAFSFNAGNSGKVSTAPTSVSAKSFNFSGPVPSISANGNSNAILWGLDNGSYRASCVNGANCQVLYAYDATNLAKMLYNSSQAANRRDIPGSAVKFTSPTVANGKVYVGSNGSVSAFGLLAAAAPAAAAPSFSPVAGNYQASQSVTIADATPGAVVYYTTDGSAPTTASSKYTAPIKISGSTTINALAAASGYANSAVRSAGYTISTASVGGSSPVSLLAAANVYAIAKNGSPVPGGGADGYGDAYSSTLLSGTVAWAGVTFDLGALGGGTAASASTLSLPSGNYTTLNLLATAVEGAQGNQRFVVTYTDGTTTVITQSLSDWFTPQSYGGESKAVTMAYRLTSTGTQQPGPFYLYGYSFSINSAKTVKSVTLPSNRNVIIVAATLSGSPAQPSPPTSPAPPAPPANGAATASLASVANVHGLFDDGSPVTDGGLDSQGYAYSKTLLGASLTWSGTTFAIGGAGAADAASSVTIPLPAGQFKSLQLLATGMNGNQVNQRFTVTYTDGTTTAPLQSVSDWYTPQSYAGESKASSMAYRLLPTGAIDNRTFYLYGYTFALDGTKTVKSLTLPNNRNVVVLAAELLPSAAAPPEGSAVSVSLISAANVNAIFNDGSPISNGGIDTGSTALSENVVGTSLTYAGVPYTLIGAGMEDAVSGNAVSVTPGKFSTLNLLGLAVHGAQGNQAFVVTYSDGTTSVISKSLSDWAAPQNYPGESIALSMPYRLTAAGAADNRPFYLYAYSLAINNAKTLTSVRLPGNRNVVVLAATLMP